MIESGTARCFAPGPKNVGSPTTYRPIQILEAGSGAWHSGSGRLGAVLECPQCQLTSLSQMRRSSSRSQEIDSRALRAEDSSSR
jgi:hypothetical protein